MKRKPNILFVPRWYPTAEHPLNGIFIHRHAIAISKVCNVAVLFAEVRDQKEQIVYETSIDDGIRVFRYFYKKHITGIGIIDKILRIRLYFRCMKMGWDKIKRKADFDLLHVHVLLRTGIFANYIQKKDKIPFVVTEHWTGYLNGQLKGIKKIWTKRILRKAKAISAVSVPLKDAIQKITNLTTVRLIPNVVDTSCFSPVKTDISKNVILHISDLKDDHKNVSGLIKAAKKLSEIREDFEVHIVGKGPDEKDLKWLVKGWELEGKVKFLGELHREDVLNELNSCRFLSLFSNYETFGVVLIEALACGKPVVASKLPAIERIISNDYGMLVRPGNVEELVSAFDYMLNNYQQYRPKLLHQYVDVEYSYDSVARKFLNMYKTVLKDA